MPRKLSTGNSGGAVVAGSGPLLLSPSQLLTDAACWQGHGGTCNVFGILLGHISFSIKITAVFQLFPSEGISFPWTEARCFLSAACTPLHHLSFPGGTVALSVLQKGSAPQPWRQTGCRVLSTTLVAPRREPTISINARGCLIAPTHAQRGG